MTVRTVFTIAALTIHESSRRRVLRALVAMTLALLALSAFGFSRIDAEFSGLTSGEARLVASIVLNLVMFGLSLIAALGTAFLAGPTMAGEIESGMALSVLARPVRRSAVLVGKWLGLVVFGSGFVVVAGLSQFGIVWATVGYWPPDPVQGLALLAAQTTVLLTLGLMLATVITPMASGIVGTIGELLDNDGVASVGTVSRILLPTDGLWRGAMHSFQDPTVLAVYGINAEGPHPFLGDASLTITYLGWVVVWLVLMLGLASLSFRRRDL